MTISSHNNKDHGDGDDKNSSSMYTRRIRRTASSRKGACSLNRRFQVAAVIVLVGGFLYLLVNHFQQRTAVMEWKNKNKHGHVRSREQWVSPSSRAFNENNSASNARNLILVAGHSVTAAGHLEDADQDEMDWFLLPYQKHRGLPAAIVAHITAGIQAAQLDSQSLLVFSGGETRAASGPDTEGASYFRVADAMHLWPPQNSNVRARTLAEEYARDSFENLLFSICRFHEVTQRYPETITVVSFSFKEKRFSSLHAHAIRWPPSKFFYIGIDPSPSTGFNLDEASKGERENAAKPFETDPYGCHTRVLRDKRMERNPFHRTPPYELTCPEMKGLLHHCGPALYPSEKLPWNSS